MSFRPTFDRLPEIGYQDNEVVEALVSPYDRQLTANAATGGAFWLDLLNARSIHNPFTSSESQLVQGVKQTLNMVSKGKGDEIDLAFPDDEVNQLHTLRIKDISGRSVWDLTFTPYRQHIRLSVSLEEGDHMIEVSYAKHHLERSIKVRSRVAEDDQVSARLDYLAYLVGFEPWSRSWQTQVKANLIQRFKDLQSWRGTKKALKMYLDAHMIPYDFWGDTTKLKLSFTLPAKFGYKSPKVWVRVPLDIPRNGKQYQEVSTGLASLTPVVSRVGLSYKGFYLGFSKLGDPIFKK